MTTNSLEGHVSHVSPNLDRTPPARVAATLRAAADHLQAVGLHQGGLYDMPELNSSFAKARCCGWGAVDHVTHNGAVAEDADYALSVMVRHRFPGRYQGHYPYWNDEPGRTQEEVLELMRATADAVEQRQAPFTLPEPAA